MKGINTFAETVVEAFMAYQREYLRKSEEEALDELSKFDHCRQLVTSKN